MILALILLVLIHVVFGLVPFIDKRKQMYVLIVTIMITLLMILVPPNWLWNIRLPIINNTIDGFAIEFMSATGMYSDVLKLIPTIEVEVLEVVRAVVRGLIACIVLSLMYLITVLVMYIIHITKIKTKIALNSVGFACVVIGCVLMIISPFSYINAVKMMVNDNIARKGETLSETYSYNNYDEFIQLIDGLSFNSPVPGITSGFMDLFTFNKINVLETELYEIDSYLLKFKDTGATIIYTDKNFKFRQATRYTFNFDAFKELIVDTLNSRWYQDVGLIYANQIMDSLEERVAFDIGTTKSNVNLEFTESEFREQYDDLMDMLHFAIENDLSNKASNLSFSNLKQFLKNFSNGDLLNASNISKSPIISKMSHYVEFDNDNEVMIYGCVRLYDAIDDWLLEYKQTSLYTTIMRFLSFRDIIKVNV